MTTRETAADKAAAKEAEAALADRAASEKEAVAANKAAEKTAAKLADKAAVKQASRARIALASRTDLLHVAAVLLAAGKDPDQAVKGACGLLEALDNHLEPEKEDASD